MINKVINHERWLEMDLYWFQGAPVESRVQDLFDRLAPLWKLQSNGRCGLALCVGWLLDSVLYWNGDASQVIPTCQAPTYEPWTYARLGSLTQLLQAEATKRGISNFHVGLILLGAPSMMFTGEQFNAWAGRTEERNEQQRYNIVGHWFSEHPEVMDARFKHFSWSAPVHIPADEKICTDASPSFGHYLAKKLSTLFSETGLSAVIFRDDCFSAQYVRGKSGMARFMESNMARQWTDGIIATLLEIRALSPDTVIIGYDSGTSVMEEWRSFGFDLERVARAGCLDVWITQTWASAWQDYWPAHAMGYTFQLARVLLNQAMLAGTTCKHLYLIETFDAWEPWDSIHQYPSKVFWEIWAYSHASLLQHDGSVQHPDGFYMSWMNRRDQLLPEETVAQLGQLIHECQADLAKNPRAGGPCVVYHRAGLEALLENPVNYCRGEAIDDWISMLIKYGTPCLSITRSEWLPDISADGYIVPVPCNLDEHACTFLLNEMRKGKTVLLSGSAEVIPPLLRKSLDIDIVTTPVRAELPSAATISSELQAVTKTSAVIVNQKARSCISGKNWESLIDCLGGPIFLRHRALPCFIWETPEWGTPTMLHLTVESIQSPQYFWAIASAINHNGWGNAKLQWRNADWLMPVCFLFQYNSNNTKNIVLGNLETGITGNSQFGATGVVRGVKQLEIINRDDAARCMIVENGDEASIAAIASPTENSRRSPQAENADKAPIVALGPYRVVLFQGK
jgi:hypothetical protein